jgi:hypothetical protein
MGNPRSRSSEPVTWPTAERSPHKSPSPGTGAPWGDCGGLHGACAARASSGDQTTRRRRDALSSGGSAGGVTPSAATGAAFEPLRSLQDFGVSDIRSSSGPATGMAGDRGDDLAGGTGPQRSGGSGPSVSSSSGLRCRAAARKPRPRSPGTGTGRCPCAGRAGLLNRSSMPARSAQFNKKQKGAKGPWFIQDPALPSS